jgi:hypothetical protein
MIIPCCGISKSYTAVILRVRIEVLVNSQEKACIMMAIVRFLPQDYPYG